MEDAPSSPVQLETDATKQAYQQHAALVDNMVTQVLKLAQTEAPALAHAAVAGALTAIVRAFIEKTGTVVQVVSEREVMAALIPLIANSSGQVLQARTAAITANLSPAAPPKERKLHKLKGGKSRG